MSWCCRFLERCEQFCSYISTCFSFSLCCFFLGAMFSALFFIFYYGVFFPTVPMATLEHTGMYDYADENPILKRDVNHETKELDHEEYYDYSAYDDEISRNKRQSTGDASASTPTLLPVPGVDLSSEHPVYPAFGPVRTPFTKHHTTPTPTTTPTTTTTVEYGPDIHLSNKIVDSVFEHTDKENMSLSLGLCRKNAEVKLPEMKETPLSTEDATNILTCLNEILKNQTKNRICVQLDPEMNAYLRWLIITGEPKEKHKPVKLGVKDDFLFPSTPCSGAAPLNAPQCLVEHGFEDTSEE